MAIKGHELLRALSLWFTLSSDWGAIIWHDALNQVSVMEKVIRVINPLRTDLRPEPELFRVDLN